MALKRSLLAVAGFGLALAVCALPSDAIVTNPSRALAIAYYPSRGELALQLNLAAGARMRPASSARARILDERGAELASRELGGGSLLLGRLTLPDLSDGSYRVVAEALTAEGRVQRFEQRFVRRRFPWEGNDLGLGRTVFRPFEPLRTSERGVDLVLRHYEMNGVGLWESVRSEGRELLASPMAIPFETAAGQGAWRPVRAEFTRTDADRVVFEAENDGGAVVLRTRSTIDVDGCMRVELELLPGAAPQVLQSLSVELPIRNVEAPLWHLVRSGDIRRNPSGLAPAGSGVVWRSTDADNGSMLGSLFPYLFLGGEKRGLAFFADNDRGWIGEDADPALELAREGETLRLRLRLVRKPTRLEKPIRIVFGLQASPTKPMPADWRRRDISMMAATGAFWGMVSTYADKYPAGGDFSIADALVSTRRSGVVDAPFIDRWIAQKYALATPELATNRRITLERGFGFLSSVRARPQIIYFDGSTQNLRSPDWAVFQDEWAPIPFRARETERPIRTLPEAEEYKYLVTRSRSYQDFVLWYAREWMRRGFGIGVDNVFLGNCYDLVMCNAFLRSDGKIQPSAEIWALREYFRRMWTLEREIAPESPFPLVLGAHMTNSLLLPVASFVDLGLDNEWKRLEGIAQFPHRPDFIRGEMLGRQVGVYPYAFSALSGDPGWHAAHREGSDPVAAARLERTEWAMRLVHEIARYPSVFDVTRRKGWPAPDRELEALIRRFGYGSDDIDVLNYWGDGSASGVPRIEVGEPGIKWIGLWKPATRELLVVLVNWSMKDSVASSLRVHFASGYVTTFRDAEREADVEGPDLVLAPGQVRVLRGEAGSDSRRLRLREDR